jgi:DNA ligase (NAD+)
MPYRKIIAALKKADSDYYNTGNSEYIDAEYDKLKAHLKSKFGHVPEVVTYLSSVGADAPEHLAKVPLTIHMGSQDHAMTDDEFWSWYNKYNKPSLVISDKVDGSSAELTYENGVLKQAVTRGDGEIGSDITQNARQWHIPQTISEKGTVVVRGEAVLHTEDWQKYFPDRANPRNAGNGIVMRKDGQHNEHIHFYAFNIDCDTEFKFLTDKFVYLRDVLGFDVPDFHGAGGTAVEGVRKHYLKVRDAMPYWIDGMVCTIDNIEEYDKLGYFDGGRRPRGSIAWKFASEKGVTKVIGMTLTIGHTGAIVPTAKLEPIMLGGTTVQNVLLNNFTYVEELDLNVGDEVLVEKAGDIIPHVVEVTKKNTNGPYPPPADWKGFPVRKQGRHWIVDDPDCPDLSYQRIRNWIKKTGIKHLGDEVLTSLWVDEYVVDIYDLYKLDISDMANLKVGNGVLGKSLAKKIWIEISGTKNIKTDIFMGALGIKFLGRQQARLIRYPTPQDYLDATPAQLAKEDGMGDNKAADMHKSIQARRGLIEDLLEIINVMPLDLVKANVDGKLHGKSFCFTGCRPSKEEEEKLAELGGIVKSGVSKGLTYLVIKDATSTSNKAEKARKYGTEVIDLNNFQELIDV